MLYEVITPLAVRTKAGVPHSVARLLVRVFGVEMEAFLGEAIHELTEFLILGNQLPSFMIVLAVALSQHHWLSAQTVGISLV